MRICDLITCSSNPIMKKWNYNVCGSVLLFRLCLCRTIVVSEMGISNMIKHQTSMFNTSRYWVIRMGPSKRDPRTLVNKWLDCCPFEEYPDTCYKQTWTGSRKRLRLIGFAGRRPHSQLCAANRIRLVGCEEDCASGQKIGFGVQDSIRIEG